MRLNDVYLGLKPTFEKPRRRWQKLSATTSSRERGWRRGRARRAMAIVRGDWSYGGTSMAANGVGGGRRDIPVDGATVDVGANQPPAHL